MVTVAVFIALVAIGTESSATVQQRLWQGVGLLVACGLVAGGYVTVVRADAAKNQTGDGIVPATIVFDAVCFTVGGLVIVSFANPADPRRWAATILWSLACLAIGAFAGFLFGIPRSRRESRPPTNPQNPVPAAAAANPPADPSTGAARSDAVDPSPIEQISDWLTKIIVGLGLANLKQLPEQLDTWAHYVASSVGSFAAPGGATAPANAGASLALGMILYFLILGFMACYILTQIFLRNLINRSSAD